MSSGPAFTQVAATPSYCAAKAGIHLPSESIRLQYADTSVQIIEFEPPPVRTGLLAGQETSEVAMPLDEFISEAVGPLESEPDAKEIQVERVEFLRHGEAFARFMPVGAFGLVDGGGCGLVRQIVTLAGA